MEGIPSCSRFTIPESGFTISLNCPVSSLTRETFYETMADTLEIVKVKFLDHLPPDVEEDKRKQPEGPSPSPKPSKKAKKIIV
ncbi:hypothetical protein HNY73_011087 [Argiope bruennichi]|uniref:Uncharacterized protein n=1 Tax=Argiope bruennichi TaxID=94029 RepID=A0A8T0F808_ARGBR|nr:hypothetical protein HNY73_011087 [Argiope bruennichi]